MKILVQKYVDRNFFLLNFVQYYNALKLTILKESICIYVKLFFASMEH